jgi:glucosamine-6-phosphate deaminase
VKTEILGTAADVAVRGASFLEQAIRDKPTLVTALPTGRTPIAMYEVLAAKHRAGEFDLGAATVFYLDEVLLPKEMPQTFFQFMTRHVWDPLGVAPRGRRIPRGEATDTLVECARYEAEIQAAGGLDLAILGIGADGHIAYNLPGQVERRTHVVSLDQATISTLGGNTKGPVRAITMGVDTILSARRLLLLATGSSKAEALRRMRTEAPNGEWPCTFFRGHADLTVVADTAAAAQL